LANDPLETTDVADRHPGQVAVLRASLEAANAQRVAGASPGPAPSGPAPDLSAEQEAEIEQHLEQLGYL
jgi:hypothetical protein